MENTFTNTKENWDAYDFGTRPGVSGDDNTGRMGMVHAKKYLYFMPGKATGICCATIRYWRWTTLPPGKPLMSPTSSSRSHPARPSATPTAVFDGRYVYYAPYFDGDDYHGRAVRYDTHGAFSAASSWEATDIALFFPGTGEARGYNGAVYDGRFIYYMPYHQKPMFCLGYHGKAVRYDTHAPFAGTASWKAMDIEHIFGPKVFATGFVNGVYADHYIYYIPYFNSSGYHGTAVRYHTKADFEDPAAWQTIQLSGIFPEVAGTKGYNGGVYDGRYIYYAPYNNGNIPIDVYHGKMIRFDTHGDFLQPSSWEANDLGQAFAAIGIPDTRGYQGAAFDGQYIYYAPWYNGSEFHGKVLRFNTRMGFAEPAAWKSSTSLAG